MDELDRRQLPSSLEAEQAVLGAMLIDARCIPAVVTVLRTADFYSQVNQEIFDTIYRMFSYSQVIDPVTVLDQMKQGGVYHEDSSRNYILELMSITPTAANVMEYVQIVRDKSMLRSIADVAADVDKMVFSGTEDAASILDLAEQRLYALRQGRRNGGLQPVSKVLVDVYHQISERAKSDSDIPGLTTGLIDVDHFIMGLNDSDLILIASRPGMGKTSIALNMALHVGKKYDKAVAIFSLEMSREQLALRLLSGEAFIDNKKLQTSRLSEGEWRKIAAAAAAISQTQILIEDNPILTVADMNAQCRSVRNLGLVIIDYLQLIQSAGGKTSGNENRTQVVSDISRMMKIMAKELNVPVICLSQLNRASADRRDKRPVLSDLRESGSIEQDADIVLGLYRDEYYNPETEDPGLAECIVMKNRRGETGTIKLKWLPEYTTYSSVDLRHDDMDE